MAAVLSAAQLARLAPGDIGLVRLAGLGTFGAIRTGRLWAVKARDPVTCAAFPAIAAWRVPGAAGADLAAFLREAAGAPFSFGAWDCALTVANWVERATGRDPAPELRGHYATRLGWLRLVNRAGGLAPLFADLARNAGLPRIG